MKANNPLWLDSYQGAKERGLSEEDAATYANAHARATRLLSNIAAEIQANWPKPYFGAVPYIRAMFALMGMSDNYGQDDASDIVARFLGNAQTWKGDVARRVKAELNNMLKSKGS